MLRRLSHQAFVERSGPYPRTFCSNRWSDKVERWARYCFQIGFRFERTIVPTHASRLYSRHPIHLLDRAHVIRSLSVFLLVPLFLSPSIFFFYFLPWFVLRFGSSRRSIRPTIDLRDLPGSSAITHHQRERYTVESGLSSRIFYLDDLDLFTPSQTFAWFTTRPRGIRVNDQRLRFPRDSSIENATDANFLWFHRIGVIGDLLIVGWLKIHK